MELIFSIEKRLLRNISYLPEVELKRQVWAVVTAHSSTRMRPIICL